VWPYLIIGIYAFFNQPAGFFKTNLAAAQTELLFKDSIHPFRNGILIRISIIGHTDGNVIFFQPIEIPLMFNHLPVMYQRNPGHM
jgi:hypothetical protein